ncbi:aminofutalosine deaminase family hydrolase [Campylobacter sp. 19-13652]|uniref:aminofutalosine deaminase family hydrolase n=1 Tax=Campylobacter sp. 19-13652 TaxID=2840180 RepID=UPI001C7700DE|nr:aminofutalosine deaminase family hydrolase [Campylobacter sp. 19-13652]BCX78886.1 chlorohydrolase [Campylobacter sp. 19-13652]
MQILKPKRILTCDDDFTILKDVCIAFSDQIVKIAPLNELKKLYPNAKFIDFSDCVLAPAFVNTHIHFEFSSHKGQLKYGDFLPWLGSIMEHGSEVRADEERVKSAINSVLKSGTASVGAVSSFGAELNALVASPLRSVIFTEAIGSSAEKIEQSWGWFMSRFDAVNALKSDKFIPALSVHSPYSVHKELAKRVIKLAKECDLICCSHFMESLAERRWLEQAKGGFEAHLKRFSLNTKPLYSVDEFKSLFDGLHTLFTHCVFVRDFKEFDKSLHFITHCPVSNRLLGKRSLSLNKIARAGLCLNIGTDGLSSNFSLSMLDELRAALFIHSSTELNTLARTLFRAATSGGARALRIDAGEIAPAKLADFALFNAPLCEDFELAAKIILNEKEARALFIGGSRVF